MQRWLMKRWMKNKNPEAIMSMMSEMMSEMMAAMKPQDMMAIMGSVMPRMMDQCFASMRPDETISNMHQMIPKMMDSCLSKMNAEDRKRMISMCRDILNEIQQRHTA